MSVKEKVKQLAKRKNMNDHLAPQSDDIKNLFGGSSSSETDIIKELFSSSDIKTRTEVTDREISIISRLYFLSKYIDNDTLESMLQNFLELKLSRKRKSRGEFIEGLKGMPKNDFNLGGLGGMK